jgi:hypothetical protein
MNLVSPKVEAKHELQFNKPASELTSMPASKAELKRQARKGTKKSQLELFCFVAQSSLYELLVDDLKIFFEVETFFQQQQQKKIN